ncbi:tyrosine-type recombinase/integrase [Tenacibaculum halocynthiae]|uniref:tyrosine-type recombinase/integrase n=1 Tax=Tenacibaculum halocynthiae TaxID=1254437 RepID=UPI003892E775
MKITLRTKKLKNGMLSLYLDYYTGTDSNGKIIRRKKTLKGFDIHEKPKNTSERKYNKEKKELAEKIKTQEQNKYNHQEYGFNEDDKLNADFLEYFQTLTNKRFESYGNYGSWDSTLKHLKKFTKNKPITFKDIDYHFVLDFKNYLQHKALKKNGEPLSQNSQYSYFNKFRASLKEAYRARIISDNPATRVEGIKEKETFREYLTQEEIETLAETPLKPKVLKNAFIFSCLTGLRFGDIKNLKWSQIEILNGEKRIKIRQKKTESIQYIDLHPQASDLIGKKGVNDLIFHGLKYDNEKIKNWVKEAGINKKITFHCGRHSHATLLMTSGADLYVIKEILGHKHIHTTQIYTKVVSQRRKEAIKKLPILNLNYEL